MAADSTRPEKVTITVANGKSGQVVPGWVREPGEDLSSAQIALAVLKGYVAAEEAPGAERSEFPFSITVEAAD